MDRREQLKQLIGDFKGLGGFIEVAYEPKYLAPPAVFKELRTTFNAAAAANHFVRMLARNQPGALMAKGVTVHELCDVEAFGLRSLNDFLPELMKKTSVGHILPLSRGGTNDFANLILWPDKVLKMKERLETWQLEHMEDHAEILTVRPKRGADGMIDRFPIFPKSAYEQMLETA